MKLCPICATSYPAGHRTCPTHGTVLVDTPELLPGTVIRDCYRIERTLGKGGMGIVYLAEHTLMGEPRALKFLSSALASNPTFVQRFLQEARAASKLRHPNIAATLELGQAEDGSFYISMEYVDGPSLRAVMEQYPRGLPLERTVAIVYGVAGALSAAHAKRLVHRDIKPENVLLATAPESEIAKVVDFGIVAISDSASRLTQTGRPLLTAEYAAPEQWRGSIQASELDGRTDLYSLGCMFFEMLTGQLPFHADTYEGWFEKHVYATPPSPSYLRPELNNIPGLDKVVLHLLAKEREQRTANVQEFLAELDRVLPASLASGSGSALSYTGQDPSQRRHTMLDTSEAYRGQGSPVAPTPFPSGPQQTPIPPKYDTFGTPRNQPSTHNGGNGAGQIPVPIPNRPIPPRLSGSTRGLARYRGVLLGALGAFLLIVLGAIVLVVWQRREEAARQNQTAQADQTDQSSPQRSTESQAQPGSEPGTGTASVPNASPSNPAQTSSPQSKPGPVGSNQPNSVQTGSQVKPPLATKIVPAPPKPAEIAQRALGLYQQEQFAQAEPLLAQACNAGQGDSCDYLGRMYQRQQGVEQDYKRAWSLYSEACDDGSFQGCNHLASMYNRKLAVPQDFPRAATLYGKACNGGVLEACNDLAFMYQMKTGVEQDYPHALSLYQKACDGGVALACNNLGIMYQDKEGVPQDYARAATYYAKACEGGNPRGCSDLGDLYRTGNGVPRDADKARTYLSKGCSMGNQWGCDRLKQVN
jgi:serine/threonine protein kinase/TPR repeat protein